MLSKLIGNEPNKEIFRRLCKTGRLPHSLLFVGKDGTGKKQFALEAAKFFLCLDPKNFESCDRCKNCRRASNFALPAADDKDAHQQIIFSEHPDVGLVVPYRNNILVDTIRALEREANFLPFEAKARFFIIDEAEKMNDAAANALLKTLEEPTDSTYIFLITARPSALLPTILSRCQTIRFAPVAAEEIENFLLESEKHSSEDARLIARIARGSIGTALEIDLEKFRAQRRRMLEVIEALSRRRVFSGLLRAAEELNDPKIKDEYENHLEILQVLIHDLLLLRHDSARKIVNFDLLSGLEKLSAEIPEKAVSNWLRDIETLRENLRSNLNRKIATDALFMRMSGAV